MASRIRLCLLLCCAFLSLPAFCQAGPQSGVGASASPASALPATALPATASSTPALPSDAVEVEQEIQQLEAMLPQVPDRGPVLFLIAHEYAHLGRMDKALSRLRDCLALDEGFDPEEDDVFAALKADPEFNKLLRRVHRRYPAVHRARVAFTVQENDLIPEGLAANGSSVLYMGGLNRRKIVRIAQDGRVSDFVKEGQYKLASICGLKVEPANGGLWANTCPDSGSGAELLHFDGSGKLTERYSPPTAGKHLFNDLALRSDREIFLTDSLANRVYKFDRAAHAFAEISLYRPIFYPNGIALSGDGNLLYVADAFGLVQVDLRDKSSSEVVAGTANTVSGADGLYWYKNSLVAVQNSLGSSRVAQFHLSPDGRKVVSTAVLEYRSPLVQKPTTGAIVGSKFYFM